MGYATSYELDWTPQPNCELSEKKLAARVAAYIIDHDEMSYALEENGDTAQSCKWYDHEPDMRAMSKAIPNVLFHLSGEGEESGDIWDAWFLNGKGQKHHVQLRRKEKPDLKGWK